MSPEFWIFVALDILLTVGLAAAYYRLRKENEELVDYIDELLEEQAEQSEEAVAVKGARLAVEQSGAVDFANEWVAAMPDDTVRDFVVKFDGWEKEDWTMWMRMPFGKYQEHKAEIDFAMGRNILKENNDV